MGKQETELQNAIRVVLSELGIVRRNNVGIFLTPNGYPISVGIPGESDLTLFSKGGQVFFIEIKTPLGRQSKQQKHFQVRVEELGYEYIILRGISDAVNFVKLHKDMQ